jgi:hypothetical protein
METFVQPKVTGYRQLNEREAELMNEIKAHGMQLGALVEKLRATQGLDQRWVSIGATDLQTGTMALVRAVAQPRGSAARLVSAALFAHACAVARSAVVGELDEDLDANLDLSTIMAPPLKSVFH